MFSLAWLPDADAVSDVNGHQVIANLQRACVCPARWHEQVLLGGRQVRLSRKCIGLLATLMAHPNTVVSRAELERTVWGDELQMSDTLRSHMFMLRRALTDADGHSPIETVHGFGYRLASHASHAPPANADVQPAR